MNPLVELMRPSQWYKNLVVFIALVFSGNLFNPNMIFLYVAAFFALCFFSSTIYVINDVVDLEKDRQHPEKCKRPMPSKKVTTHEAYLFAVFLLLVGLFIAININFMFVVVSFIFLSLGLLYNFYLKRVFILDVIAISINFVIRAYSGLVVFDVGFSSWIIICTFLLAMILALGKRKSELLLLEGKAGEHRFVLSLYKKEIINNMITVAASSLLIAYVIYSTLPKQDTFFLTTLPVATFILFKYLYYVLTDVVDYCRPDKFLRDRQTISAFFLWCILVLISFYLI